MSTSQVDMDTLFANAMKGQWDEVLQIYKKSPKVQKAKITKSEDTALHIAVSVGQTDTALELAKITQNGILEIGNAKGNTPLHIAASLGNIRVCESMVLKDAKLLTIRNLNGETPLFLAALHGKREAFLYLHSRSKEEYLVRRTDGDTILHAAISGEYFSLAMSIIHCHPGLANAINENGLSPLHILASKPNAFHSSTRLGLFDRCIYHCLVINELNEESHDVEAFLRVKDKKRKETLKYPENYKTCINFFGLLSCVFHVLSNKLVIKSWILSLRVLHKSLFRVLKGRKKGGKSDEENPKQMSNFVKEETPGASSSAMGSESKRDKDEISVAKSSTSSIATSKDEQEKKSSEHQNQQKPQGRRFPPNYGSIVLFLKLMVKALLIILGIGIWRIKKIQRKKELHMWAKRTMDALVMHTSSYKYDNTGLDPHQTPGEKVPGEEFTVPSDPTYMHEAAKNIPSDSSFEYDHQKWRSDDHKSKSSKKTKTHRDGIYYEIEKQHTPILIAAKMGVTEMVEKILDEFPVAIQDLDTENKNVVLLAVENRQPKVYNLLLNRNIPKENVFRQLDKDGNSALHLAAQCKEHRPWLIPGVALQMQWEIKWYKFVKHSMPPQFFPRYNTRHETPKEVFITTHKELIKEGGKWLTKTAESCSVVAALVATVAFSTTTAVPGGVDQNKGIPLLLGKPAFEAFAISSLVALCFSITALVFFLSILTSRCQEKDFAMDLPRKLLLGLTSLFASIASMLVSFCDGHIFILTRHLTYVAIPLYAALCFPVSYFALAQLSLYFDLIWAIFKKVPQRCNKAFLH